VLFGVKSTFELFIDILMYRDFVPWRFGDLAF